MKHKTQNSFTILKVAACALLAFCFVASAQAQDAKIDPTGTWIWANARRNGGPGRTNTLVLKYQNNVLSGTVQSLVRGGPANRISISDGKLEGDQISFKVSREVNGNVMITGYEGRVAEDTIKGKISTERDGETQSHKWEARREASFTP
ncbi:MAG TPA: hypothetical protein VFC44_10330 [Candidatus Saccharimonadales bacterium]|nr:hypothetical protein [Candidatus Saccharimonadales bacterium]